MLIADNYKYSFVERDNRLNYVDETPLSAHDQIYSIYMNSNGDGTVTNCCPVQHYWKDSESGCVPITVANCLESNDNTECTKCMQNYNLFDGVCCEYNKDNSAGAGTCTVVAGYTDDCAP